MGIFDKIKRSTGLDYLEAETPKKSTSSKTADKSEKKLPPIGDSDLRAMEIKLQKAIETLQEVRERLRVRRGI